MVRANGFAECFTFALRLAIASALVSCSSSTESRMDQLAFRYGDGFDLVNADGSGSRPIWHAVYDGPMCPAWSPDGRSIAFHLFTANQIYVLSVESETARQLTNGSDWNQCPMWSPNGNRIAYLSGPSTAPNGFALHVMNADGSGQTQLGTGGFDADRGAWSPDGRWILVPAYLSSHLVLVNALTGAVGRELTSGPDRAPAWSPDGSLIAFSRQVGDVAIFVMHADGTSLKQLTTPPTGSSDGYPSWSPDGSLIAFHRYGPAPLVATLLLVDLQGTIVPWPDGLQHSGDLPIWRPRQ